MFEWSVDVFVCGANTCFHSYEFSLFSPKNTIFSLIFELFIQVFKNCLFVELDRPEFETLLLHFFAIQIWKHCRDYIYIGSIN